MFKNTLGFVFVFVCALMFSNANCNRNCNRNYNNNSLYRANRNSPSLTFFSSAFFVDKRQKIVPISGSCYVVGLSYSLAIRRFRSGTITLYQTNGCGGESYEIPRTAKNMNLTDINAVAGFNAFSFIYLM
ncbi:hypothetical protein AYI69_g3446 [Smittium culicis]|uniref:Uncharacterized protein n=1 Tax=Smittium culicis TaxID=133412 RepID=A0A1R1YJP0_9FUNG|nr:hypothetical protein AYI69_g3446 [Smittium culicis]